MNKNNLEQFLVGHDNYLSITDASITNLLWSFSFFFLSSGFWRKQWRWFLCVQWGLQICTKYENFFVFA